MKKYSLIILAFLFLWACKPTEKNYQAAYDKAFEAAQRKAAEDSESLSGGRLESLNGPREEKMDGETVLVSRTRIHPFETTLPEDAGKAGVAIAHYKMPTNARRHAEDLKGKYPEAFVGKDGAENYYVIIQTVESSREALPAIRDFMEQNPDYRFIGMPEGPQMIYIIK